MKKFTSIILIIGLGILATACHSARLLKKGAKMEEAGMYADAADYYYQSIMAKSSNVEAKMGMKRTGQRVLDKKLSTFNKSYNESNNKEAVYNFKEADEYYNKITRIGVELNFPSYYREYYDEVKDIYLADKYIEAHKLLASDKFTEAEKLFREITTLQPTYKDAKEKLNIALYEPVYREGQLKLDNKLYRSAYYLFNRIVRDYGNYKDSYDLKAECLKKATLYLAIYPVENKTTSRDIQSSLEALIFKAIQEKQNTFLVLVEGSNQTSTRPANDISLYTTITAFVYNKGTLKEIEKRGYIKKQKQVKDEAGNVKTVPDYEKTVYKEYSMNRNVKVSFTYKLVKNKTGEILVTNSHTFVSEDNIVYGEYGGDKKNLIPGYWKNKTFTSGDDVINDNAKDIKALNDLLNARKVVKDYNTLNGEVMTVASEKIADAVNNYDPER